MKILILAMCMLFSPSLWACAGFTIDHIYEKNDLVAKAFTFIDVSVEQVSQIEILDYTGTDRIYVCEDNYEVQATLHLYYLKGLGSEKKCEAIVKIMKAGSFSNPRQSKSSIELAKPIQCKAII